MRTNVSLSPRRPGAGRPRVSDLRLTDSYRVAMREGEAAETPAPILRRRSGARGGWVPAGRVPSCRSAPALLHDGCRCPALPCLSPWQGGSLREPEVGM